MKNKKIHILVLALVLVAAAVAGIIAWAAATTPQTTYLDFEDGKLPFYTVSSSTGALTPVPESAIITDASGNKMLNMADGKMRTEMNTYLSYTGGSKAYTTFAALLSADAWKEGTRPTQVKFRFKAGNISGDSGQNSLISVHPLMAVDGGWGYYGAKVQIQVNKAGKITFNQSYQQFVSTNPDGKPIKSGEIQFDNSKTMDESPWYTFSIEYDWSKFTQADGYIVSYECQMTDGVNTVYFSDTVQWTAPNATEYTGNDPTVSASDGFTVGLEGGNSSTMFAAVDDICIWSEDVGNPEVTYAPSAQVVALGAVGVTNEVTGKLNVRSSFDFRTAVMIMEGNGETVTAYGSLTVAGTKNYEEMQQALQEALNGNVPEGYKLLKNPVLQASDVPDIYTVTVTNSGEEENVGKRMSCIAYIVTDQGTYFSQNSNEAMGVTYGVVNKSVMGLIKDAFNQKYLTTEYSAGLSEVLTDYNAANKTSYSVTDIQKITTKTGVTTQAEKELLQTIFEQMQTISPGGSEVFPGNW